jgi:hypothetical protein
MSALARTPSAKHLPIALLHVYPRVPDAQRLCRVWCALSWYSLPVILINQLDGRIASTVRPRSLRQLIMDHKAPIFMIFNL